MPLVWIAAIKMFPSVFLFRALSGAGKALSPTFSDRLESSWWPHRGWTEGLTAPPHCVFETQCTRGGSLGIPYRQPGLKPRLQRGPTCCQRAVHLFMKDGKREQALDRGQKRGVFKTKKIPFFSVHPLQFSDLSPPLPLSCKDSNSEIIIWN